MQQLLLWSFVVNLGIVLGAGLYEARISVARWLGPSPAASPGWHAVEARKDDTGRRFWGATATVPLTLLTLASVWASLSAPPTLRTWWGITSLAALADRVLTFAYFIPEMVRLMGLEDSTEARRRAARWSRLNYVRLALVAIAWISALEALRLTGSP